MVTATSPAGICAGSCRHSRRKAIWSRASGSSGPDACVDAFGTLTLGLARLLNRTSVRTVAGAIVVVGYGLAFVGIIVRAGVHGRVYGFWAPEMGGNPFGPFVNRNHFAGWMLMALPVALGLL